MATAPVVRGVGGAFAEFVAYLAPGDYDVFAWNADKWEARGRATFGGGDDSDIRLTLARR